MARTKTKSTWTALSVVMMTIIMSATAADAPPTRVLSEANWFGADLTQFPPGARDWIMNHFFRPDQMEQTINGRPWRINPELRVWWSDDGDIMAEASAVIAPGRRGAGERDIWYEGVLDVPTSILGLEASRFSFLIERYGEEGARYHTVRGRWELQQQVEEMLRTDSAFAEVAAFAKQLASEIEYDWANYSRYTGVPVIRTPGMRYHVCAGYAQEVMEKALSLNSVASVEYWSSNAGPGHAWNVLNLVDGRRLFLDLTWFDNETVNRATGEIMQLNYYDWMELTFDEHMFRFSGIGFGTRILHHNVGTFRRRVSKTD